MKKNIICLIALFTLAFGFTSCEKESAGKTAITYYAHLELEGNSIVGVNIGAEYVEPGYKATMNGQDVTSQVVVTNNIDTSKKGVYTVKYSITNAEGFATN